MRWCRTAPIVMLASALPVSLLPAMVSAAEPLANHYNDPFVRLTDGIDKCPLPRGPFMTADDARAEAHPRVERGTSCFRAGKCSEPNSYRYDVPIARAAQQAARDAIARKPALARSSVWITVQRRFIFVHGCVAARSQIATWEALFRHIPDVDYVSVDLAVVESGRLPVRVPYPVMPSPPLASSRGGH